MSCLWQKSMWWHPWAINESQVKLFCDSSSSLPLNHPESTHNQLNHPQLKIQILLCFVHNKICSLSMLINIKKGRRKKLILQLPQCGFVPIDYPSQTSNLLVSGKFLVYFVFLVKMKLYAMTWHRVFCLVVPSPVCFTLTEGENGIQLQQRLLQSPLVPSTPQRASRGFPRTPCRNRHDRPSACGLIDLNPIFRKLC